MIGGIGTWHIERHKGKWDMLREMHDPEKLTRMERRYVYDAGISAERLLRIDRGKDVGQRKAVPFRVAEDFSDTTWQRTLRFKPNDLSVVDKIRFDINGKSVTDRLQSDFLFLMSDPPNSGRYCLDLPDTAAKYGDNEMGATMLESNPDLQVWNPEYLGYAELLKINPITFTEIEIVVEKSVYKTHTASARDSACRHAFSS